ncbi:hypothetical protein BJX70DRAFT_409080 [Aspergillus crustosus]
MAYRGNWRHRANASNRGGFNNAGARNHQATICTHFRRGRCNFGERCRYSHDTTTSSGFRLDKPAYQPTAVELDARNDYFEWKRLLRYGIQGTGYSRRQHEEIVGFWNQALEILDSDSRENHQFLAKDLVDDKLQGYDFILATADADSPDGLGRLPGYDEPFLRVMTHDSLLNCLSVDSFVGTLYTFFGGTNGERAIRYLRSVCQNLMSDDEDVSLDMMKLVLNTIYQLLSRVRRARFHEDIRALLDLTHELVSKMTATCSRADLDGVRSKIETMRRLIASANSSLVTRSAREGPPSQTTGLLSSFPMEMEIPGGRHDNDLADISQVQILPTHGEIVSDSSEYLPSTNFLQPHFLTDPLQRYIDSTFRLLRHDIFGSVKDTVRNLLQHDDLTRFPYHSIKDSGAHLYLGARVQHIFINERNELEATVSFLAPPQIRQKASNEQCRWWQESNRLEEGSLVCFLTTQGTGQRLIFFEVTVKNTSKDRAHQNKSSLVSDRFAPSITVKLATCLQQEVVFLGQVYSEKLTGVLVDFHGLIPATFVPILKNLQRIQREGELAFHRWVLPGLHNADEARRIPPPAYARKPGFVFPLKAITNAGVDSVTLDANNPESIDIIKLQMQTGLDHGQCQGLIAALTREYALIQGPPGTGKSYVGVKLVQALLETKNEAKLGPILVICYTNHALDQFLKHLLDVGIQKIIRIGGRSQATELEGKNLRVVSKEIGKTRVESQTLGMTYGDLETCMKSAGYAMKPLHYSQKGLSWDGIEKFLRRKWPSIHAQLAEPDLEGYTTVADDVLLNWLGQWQESETGSLFEALDRASNLRADINAVHEEVNRRALIQADVVGITTTALARHIETLRRLGSKVIICEEAAEVMEAHVTSALMPGVEHFIQIGDHRQLRPQIQNHALSLESSTGKKWQLDRSQFERRAVGEPGLKPAPVAQLNVQRRMRPEISQLIRRVYPNLEDHGSVATLPDVVGMQNNLFWLDHRYDEDMRDDGSRVKSHSNEWEVDMATALVRHFVRQGEYKSTDIALLTPYTGQLRKLKSSLSKDFEICLSERDLETLAADGFENVEDETPEATGSKAIEKKILLQTLALPPNSKRKVGFLRTENRINVLLSRAQHGMYLIGNTETYLNVPMWADVHSQLTRVDAVGTKLALCCPRHPDTPIICSEPQDFEKKSPEGGCSLPCTRRLEPCGHQCQAKCHSAIMHDGFACGKPCPRIRLTCDHKCPKLCGEDCGPCTMRIEDVELPCGHIRKTVFCHQMANLKIIKCDVKVEKTVPNCGHIIEVGCFEDVTSPIFRCPAPCTDILSCGHSCNGSCGNCNRELANGGRISNHPVCTKRCDRPHGSCNHRCSKACHDGESCGSCEAKCEVQCLHSTCDLSCGKACAPCIEKCPWSCIHQGSCSMPCAAPCDRLPCDERCTKTLSCGHQCPSLCGEDCPENLCQECGDKGDARVDFLEWKTYAEINLNETPIIVLGCGHFFTSESVDGVVGLDEVYTRDRDGSFCGLRDVSSSLASAVPSCPDCKQPIRQFVTKRYNRVINRAVMDETCRRFLTKGRTELESLELRLNGLEDQLNSPGPVLPRAATVHYTACKRLRTEALTLSRKMQAENQPTKRLRDAIAISQNSQEGIDEIALLSTQMEVMNMNMTTATREPDKQITLGAQLIAIKVQLVLFGAVFKAAQPRQKLSPTLPPRGGLGKSLSEMTQALTACRDLITEATKANLFRIVITATILYVQIAQLESWYHRTHPGETTVAQEKSEPDRTELIRALLATALNLCNDLGNCPELQETVQDMVRLHSGPRYEKVTLEELQSIKTAMVSGRGGIATHSGHWYNCINGHPFAIGECGMPMEQARCPECGASIGGQHHTAVEGVTRALEMEEVA